MRRGMIVLAAVGAVLGLEGNVFTFSRSFGTKAGLTPFTCTATFEYPGEGTDEFARSWQSSHRGPR